LHLTVNEWLGSSPNWRRQVKKDLIFSRFINEGATEYSLRGGNGRVDEFLDKTVDLGLLIRAEVVDIASEAHGVWVA